MNVSWVTIAMVIIAFVCFDVELPGYGVLFTVIAILHSLSTGEEDARDNQR